MLRLSALSKPGTGRATPVATQERTINNSLGVVAPEFQELIMLIE